MDIGKKIKASRKKAGVTAADLGEILGLSKSAISVIETGGLKNGVEPNTLVKIADALNDLTILVDHCQACPVRKHIFLKQFPDLNNIRHDPAIIAAKLRKEMAEGLSALDELSERFSDKDFKSREGCQEEFEKYMEQVIDVERGIEILKFELILSGVHSSRDIQNIYDRQQKKCEANGHHHPEKDAA